VVSEAAEQGNPEAFAGYGRALLYGRGVSQDDSAAAGWIRKALRSVCRKGSSSGVSSTPTAGRAEGHVAALDEFRRAAEEGYVDGQLQIAGMYLTGRGASQSDNTAAAWYLRAAEAGSPDAQAMLGWMHEVGGRPEGPWRAARWFRLAAAQGNTVARDHLTYLDTLR